MTANEARTVRSFCNANRITGKEEIDLVTGMARYSGVPVTLHAVPAGADR